MNQGKRKHRAANPAAPAPTAAPPAPIVAKGMDPSIHCGRRPSGHFIGPLSRLGVAELDVGAAEAGRPVVPAAGDAAPLEARGVAREPERAAVEGVELVAVGGEAPEAIHFEVLVADRALQAARAGVVVEDQDVAAACLLRDPPDRLVDPLLSLCDVRVEDAQDVVHNVA